MRFEPSFLELTKKLTRWPASRRTCSISISSSRWPSTLNFALPLAPGNALDALSAMIVPSPPFAWTAGAARASAARATIVSGMSMRFMTFLFIGGIQPRGYDGAHQASC